MNFSIYNSEFDIDPYKVKLFIKHLSTAVKEFKPKFKLEKPIKDQITELKESISPEHRLKEELEQAEEKIINLMEREKEILSLLKEKEIESKQLYTQILENRQKIENLAQELNELKRRLHIFYPERKLKIGNKEIASIEEQLKQLENSYEELKLKGYDEFYLTKLKNKIDSLKIKLSLAKLKS